MPDPTLQTAVELHRAGKREEAAAVYRQLLEKQPDDPEILRFLGFVTAQLGQAAEGAKMIERSIALRPNVGVSYANLAYAYQELSRLDDSAQAYQKALSLNPNLPAVWLDYSKVQSSRNKSDSAIDAARHALALMPNNPELHHYLGVLLRDEEHLDESVACFRKAIELLPNYAEAYHNLALSLDYSGRVEEAVEYEAKSSELVPDVFAPVSSRLYALHFHPGFDRASIAPEMEKFDERFIRPLATHIKAHLNNRDRDRRLKIGYVSPNFYHQAEAFFLLPLLRSHDHGKFEIHCYSSVTREDEVTAKFKTCADFWHNVATDNDEALADRIRADQIDILVDLTMHMRDSRLLMFALKPAPVQVTWLAYPGGTGVSAIDYRLTDAYLDPPEFDQYYVEKSIRIPGCWCCFHPFDREQINPQARDFIRFASLNAPSKHNETTLRLWSRVLAEVPDSRLLLLILSEDHRKRAAAIFAEAGVDASRLEFTRYLKRPEYFTRYNQIDACLDPLPYNGITTSLDALWMGVPVVTLVGNTAPSRAGLSILATAGLNELVAHTPEEFVAIAKKAHLISRHQIRRKLTQSPLFDYRGFAAKVEAAYRHMWHRYVTGEPGSA